MTGAPFRPAVHWYGAAPIPLLNGPLGSMVLRPWFDRAALHAVARWYFPLSRVWAAGIESGDSVEAFCRAVPLDGAAAGPLRPRLERLRQKRQDYAAAAAAWELGFFGSTEVEPSRLRLLERRRRGSAHAFMSERFSFAYLNALRRIPAVRWNLPPPALVAERHGDRLRADAAFPLPDMPLIEQSRWVEAGGERLCWLRFPSRVAGAPDTAWARLGVPPGIEDPPTVIFLHGIAMETEFWDADQGLVDSLLGAGTRVIWPEGPWHGRRRPAGSFGGEPVLAQGPLGMLDLFEAWVAEVSVLIRWARATSRGPVAIAGVSLGSLACQLVATAARDWPAAVRPDALLLIATTGDLLELAFASSLLRSLQLPARLSRLGWNRDLLGRWLPLLQPLGPPAVPPDRIVMLLGEADDLTPFRGGRALAAQWQLPSDAVFVRHQGHFSVCLGLMQDASPLQRLHRMIEGAGA